MTYKTKNNALSNEEMMFVVEAYGLGYDQGKIAAEMNVTRATIERILKEKGLSSHAKGRLMTPLSVLRKKFMEELECGNSCRR